MNNYIATTDEMRKSLLDQMLAFYNLPVESIEKDLWGTQVLHALLYRKLGFVRKETNCYVRRV